MLGWFISLSSISLIPIGAIYQIAKARGPMSRVSVVRSPTHAICGLGQSRVSDQY